MKGQFGNDWKSKFATFEDKPFAAASIGQVLNALDVLNFYKIINQLGSQRNTSRWHKRCNKNSISWRRTKYRK